MTNKLVYAIVPARSGSKGVPNKNIRKLADKELIGYSIDFAKKLGCDKIICSTDSERYATVAKSFGAEVPFLRAEFAASDTAMEEHILTDLYDKFDAHGIAYPALFVWLRPTFIFRDVKLVKRCIERMLEDPSLTACRTVCETENRIYTGRDGLLIPKFETNGRSMIRRQEMEKGYKVFSTDVFRGDTRNTGKNFLGDKVGFEVINRICGLDIDDEFDFQLVENILKFQRDQVRDYL